MPSNLCQGCKKPFEAKKGKQYCSFECAPNRSKICPYCSHSYVDTTSRNSMTFCSTKCRQKAKVVRKHEKAGTPLPPFLDEQTKSCVYCDSDYVPTSYGQKYCTTQCRDDADFITRYADTPKGLQRTVECKECSEVFRGCIPHGGKSGDHLWDMHGITYAEYQEKYSGAIIYSEAALWKMREADRNFPVDFPETCRNAQLQRYETDIVWNKGETRDTHPSMDAIAEKALLRYSKQSPNFKGRTHSSTQKGIWSLAQRKLKKDPIYRKNWIESVERAAKLGAYMSEPHSVLIQAMRDTGLWEGFEYEKWLTLNGVQHGIDICKPKFAIELDGCRYHGCPQHCPVDRFPSKYVQEIEGQKVRDREIDAAYRHCGWEYMRIWEHDIKEDPNHCVQLIAERLKREIPTLTKSYRELARSLDPDIQSKLAKRVSGNIKGTDADVLAYYRTRGFPYPQYSATQVKQDLGMLRKYDVTQMETSPNRLTQPRKGLGMKLSNMYMKNFWEARRYGKPSAREVFDSDTAMSSVIRSRRKHAKNITDSTMRTGLKLYASSPSSFPALVAKYIYQRYLPDRPSAVLDPCIGFGGRMTASQSLKHPVSYTGSDPWEDTFHNAVDMCRAVGWDCVLHNAEFNKLSVGAETQDMVFTSPPHYNKEVYSDANTQSITRYPHYEDWLKGFMLPLVEKAHNALKIGGYLVLHLSETDSLVGDTRTFMRHCGFQMMEDIHWDQKVFFTSQVRSEPFLIGRK